MPRTFNRLFEAICAVPNLLAASRQAARGKRAKPYVDHFQLDLEREVWALRAALLAGTYRPGAYRSFWITDPKRRLISAAPFRDRVVHHAICRVIEPLWERRFVSESCANRRGYGTAKARDHFEAGMRRYPYVLRMDVAKFFPSMDHAVLKALFRRVICCRPTLALLDRIVDASNDQEPVCRYFDGDELWTPFERRHGLPLGNQTSQFFANVYLDPIDHFIKEDLRCPQYARYVDDLAVFGESKRELRDVRKAVAGRMAVLRLRLHPTKTRIQRSVDGVTFLGIRFWPHGRRLPGDNRRRAVRRLRAGLRDWQRGRITRQDLVRRWAGWRGHALQANAGALLESIRDRATAWKETGEWGVPRGAGRGLEQPIRQCPLRQPQQEPTRQQEHR